MSHTMRINGRNTVVKRAWQSLGKRSHDVNIELSTAPCMGIFAMGKILSMGTVLECKLD